jgi:hypothetical protein
LQLDRFLIFKLGDLNSMMLSQKKTGPQTLVDVKCPYAFVENRKCN